MKKIIYGLLIVVVIGLITFMFTNNKTEAPTNLGNQEPLEFPIQEQGAVMPAEQNPEIFTGSYDNYKTDCFFDATCSAIIGGKEVITILGWSREISGTFEDPDLPFGTQLEVYANKIDDMTYTLYGSEDYYIREI